SPSSPSLESLQLRYAVRANGSSNRCPFAGVIIAVAELLHTRQVVQASSNDFYLRRTGGAGLSAETLPPGEAPRLKSVLLAKAESRFAGVRTSAEQHTLKLILQALRSEAVTFLMTQPSAAVPHDC